MAESGWLKILEWLPLENDHQKVRGRWNETEI